MTDTKATTVAPPDLDGSYDLDAAVIAGFAANGHAMVPGLCSPGEAAAYHPLIETAAIEHARNKEQIGPEGSLDRAFLQSFNLWRVDERIARFVLARRFAEVAAKLLGVERVRLYHDQALCKGPGGGRTPWHQDHYYWPLDTDRMITMWMPMIDLDPEVGSMTFASGSHLLGDLRGKAISKEGDVEFAALLEQQGIPTHTYGALHAGDATFHGGWTLHSAGRNHTDQLRTVMTVIYYADGALVADELTPAQDLDRRIWLGDRPPGAPADHEDNILL
ncbi:MAG TPA: phytanoyl-CoA dioxygenase family protein [Acidimicrobiales bacterium]|jgi:ectoine hydroxylase-related dioxygenase (phytanoyl-CoA dioxygenase family)|nr:phytanoyl-CoA dioxygenase family protein [Acidimicrobiales bacterium]